MGSRNAMNEERDQQEFRKNYRKILGIKIPHMDTVNAVMRVISNDQLQELQQKLVRILLDKRVFHKFRMLDKYFLIAIDGTGVFNFVDQPYSECPYKTSKHGKVSYHQNVVEAKLICANGFSISLSSEWITNEDGQAKQDCEYKASIRLMEKLKTAFPRLPICVIMDGLYLKYPILKTIKSYNWEFIMVWKDKTLYALQDELAFRLEEGQEKTEHYTDVHNANSRSEYEFQYGEEPLQHKDIDVYYVKGIKSNINLNQDVEDKQTKYVFMSSIPTTRDTYGPIFDAGCLRWKIENEGFNAQKNQGYALHHKMSRKNSTGIKNYYTCLQIAHLLSQLLTLAKNTVVKKYGTIKALWLYFCSLLRMIDDYKPANLTLAKYNLRY